MKKVGIYIFLLTFLIIIGPRLCAAGDRDNYKTYEIVQITENGLTLTDSDGNVVEVIKDPTGYKVGYKVRYDKIRNRMRPYRWQDYQVTAVSDTTITLQHKTGDTIVLKGNYQGEYEVGDQVRYDSIGQNLKESSEK